MAKRVVAIVGSYRKGGTVDTAVDAVLAGAREHGAEIDKIYLIDWHLEFCRNCRTCTQAPGEERGRCVIHDELASMLDMIDSADALVLASPVNFYNVTAVFRRFLERLLGCTYWPWGEWSPKPRAKQLPRRAVLIASCAAPGFLLPIATGSPRALRLAANCLGAHPVAKLWIGLSAQGPQPQLSRRTLRWAERIGERL